MAEFDLPFVAARGDQANPSRRSVTFTPRPLPNASSDGRTTCSTTPGVRMGTDDIGHAFRGQSLFRTALGGGSGLAVSNLTEGNWAGGTCNRDCPSDL
jgi:hypothetical protein